MIIFDFIARTVLIGIAVAIPYNCTRVRRHILKSTVFGVALFLLTISRPVELDSVSIKSVESVKVCDVTDGIVTVEDGFKFAADGIGKGYTVDVVISHVDGKLYDVLLDGKSTETFIPLRDYDWIRQSKVLGSRE